MKNLKILVFVAGVLCYGGMSYAQAPNSCLRLFCVDGMPDDSTGDICSNTDSVMVDTCQSSSTYGGLYGKRWFEVHFQYYVINIPQAPYDTTLEVSWAAIDTNYTLLRASFASLEGKYGTLTLKKYAPHIVDSTDVSSKVYYVRFANYACVDSVNKDLSAIGPGINLVSKM
jgi:hypothetical protein